MILVKMGENQTFLIFKHIILEFIAFDILMSYSPLKKINLSILLFSSIRKYFGECFMSSAQNEKKATAGNIKDADL